jgi:hypothetical protein
VLRTHESHHPKKRRNTFAVIREQCSSHRSAEGKVVDPTENTAPPARRLEVDDIGPAVIRIEPFGQKLHVPRGAGADLVRFVP